jgi:cation transport regulator ChaC
MTNSPASASLRWVFGHGSIMFEPRFRHETQRPATLLDWERRLGQPSIRNWGRPDHPAPTSCLVPGDGVNGMLFGVAEDDWADVYARLLGREAQEPIECVVRSSDEEVEAVTWPMSDTWADRSVEELVEAAVTNVLSGGGPHGHAFDYAQGIQFALSSQGFRDGFVSEYHASLGASLSMVTGLPFLR